MFFMSGFLKLLMKVLLLGLCSKNFEFFCSIWVVRVPTDYASLIEHLFYVEKLRCFWTLI